MRAIKNWVLATFILTFLVIIAGGIVRTTQSGMGCPDWPRCFGKWIPPTNASELPADFERYLSKQDIDHTFNVYHTWIEYFNRLFGALLGVFAIIQVALLFRKKTVMKPAYRLAIAFLVTVILTGLFGALVVKFNLAHFSISVHLLFALILTQLQLALVLSVKHKVKTLAVPAKIKKLLIGLLVLLVFQSVLGTMVRIYIDDISKHLDYQQRETWLASTPVAFLIHRSFSWAVLLATLAYTWYCRSFSAIKNKVFLLTGIILLSMATGIILFYLDMPAVAQPLHLLLATLGITQVLNILLQLRTKEAAAEIA
ncbi:heme A synthase [Ferruginibacter sp. HRS2-29]|uniref:COX15/CtaA family protein n=1 Tax=Ferruginibacter sp. HRS2-29 TaxID=2487334 RepID=UPI0020CC2972|nr:COX15/CtaA family protein [Ferruginibacter sp. HRS2-29]MCP9753019.1 heme A synthase [Ferruginibacter sp. HRS2-29]